MLVFVIPLKSQQVSKSWDFVSKLFERCVRSVCDQTSSDFKVVVVCHEKPCIEFTHPYITYVEVDFPVPGQDQKDRIRDKMRKALVGLACAREFQPSHVMVVDADDCVSKQLAEFVSQNSRCNGWFVNRGYVYQDGSKFVYFKRKDFYRWCGTCNIVKYDLLNLPERVEDDRVDFDKYYHNHREVREKLARERTPIEPLPFAGVIYVLGYGDSLSGDFSKFIPSKSLLSRLKRILFNFRPLTSSVRREFGIYDIH